MKTYAKRKSSDRKVALKRTGGGPHPPPLDPDTEAILSEINHDTEVECPFDSESTAGGREEQLSASNLQFFQIQEENNEMRLSLKQIFLQPIVNIMNIFVGIPTVWNSNKNFDGSKSCVLLDMVVFNLSL